jgi:hypothetical protein
MILSTHNNLHGRCYLRTQNGILTFDNHPTRPNMLVVAQSAPELLLINSSSGTVLRTLPVPATITTIRSSSSILLSGGSDGYLRIHDLNSPGRSNEDSSEGSTLAHVGGIQAIDTGGNYALTIGWNTRLIPLIYLRRKQC